MSDRLLELTARAIASVLTGVSPDGEQGKMRSEILALLSAPRKSVYARVAELERTAHEPYDFTQLVERIERMERVNQQSTKEGA